MKKAFNILLAVSVLALASCDKDDAIFDQTVSERISRAVTEYKSALLMGQKWVLEYYPDDNLSYGGWIYVVEFRDDRTVKAWFEGSRFVPQAVFASDPLLTESEYQVEFSTVPMLKFNTHNDFLHYFAYPDGTNGGYRGRKGDHEFCLMSMAPRMDEISMTGSKTANRMRMTPLPAEYSPEDYIQAVWDSQLAVGRNEFRVTANGEQIGTVTRASKTELNKFTPYAASKVWTINYSYRLQAAGTDGKPLTDGNGEPVYETVEVSDQLCAVNLPGGIMKLYEPYVFKGDVIQGLAGQTMQTFAWEPGLVPALDGYLCTDSFYEIRFTP